MSFLRRGVHFLRNNHNKSLSIYAFLLAGWYRFCILCFPMRITEKKFGKRGIESPQELPENQQKYGEKISRIANRICNQTKWQSKCLVRAMVAQKLLTRKHISSTLYLGVKKENDKLIAHAWLRTGRLYCTGGDGKDFTIVAKFCK
ncbi:MAG: lasso peptide biosynthesis B2 protein [Clostridiales bacterium]|nr:lasso peptide biosynthesis B2 protein [Clostridiales bacterium]